MAKVEKPKTAAELYKAAIGKSFSGYSTSVIYPTSITGGYVAPVGSIVSPDPVATYKNNPTEEKVGYAKDLKRIADALEKIVERFC